MKAPLWLAWREHSASAPAVTGWTLSEAMRQPLNAAGQTLNSLSRHQPQLVVFLRHFGCTFCRESLSDLRRTVNQLASQGISLVVFHMGSSEAGANWQRRQQLNSALFVSDPHCRFYEAFDLKRGTFGQLFGWKTWIRAIPALARGNGLGKLVGDGFRMPGVFLVQRGEIAIAYRHQSAADRPDYLALASRHRAMEAQTAEAGENSISCSL